METYISDLLLGPKIVPLNTHEFVGYLFISQLDRNIEYNLIFQLSSNSKFDEVLLQHGLI